MLSIFLWFFLWILRRISSLAIVFPCNFHISISCDSRICLQRCALIGAAVTAVICVRLTWFLSVAAAVFWAIVAAVYFGNSPLLWLSFWFNLSGCHSLTVQGPGYYLLRIPRLWNPRLPPSRILWLRRWRFHLADYNFLWCPLVLSPLAAVFTFAGTSSALHMGGAWPSQYVSAVCSFPWILRTDFRVDPKPWGPAEDRTVPPARLVVPFERSGPHPDLLGSLGPLECTNLACLPLDGLDLLAHIAMGYHLCLRWTYLMLHNFKAPGAFSTLLNRATYMFPAGLLTGYYYNPAIIIFGFLALGGPVHVWIRLQSGHNYSWTIFGRPVSWHDPRIDVGHFLSSVGRPTRDVYMGPCILSQWTSAVATSEQPNADVVLSITLQRAAPVCIRPPWATILSLWTQSFLQPGWHIELWHAAWPLLQVTYLPLPLSCPLVSHVPRFSSSSPGYLKNSAPALTLTTNSHLHSLIRYLNLLLISLYTMDSEILSAIGNLTFTVEETGEIMIEKLQYGSWLRVQTQQPRPGPRKRSGIEYFTEQIPVQSESTHEASSPSFSNEGAATGTAAGRTDSSTAGGMASSDAGHANSNPSQGLRGAGTETNATNLSAPVDATAKGDPLPAVVTAAPSEIEPHVVVVPEAIANSFEDSRTAAKGSLSAAPSESDLPAHGTALLQVECTISKDLLAQCINSESRENMVEPDNILTHAALDSLKSAIAPPLPRASKHSLQGKYEVCTPIQPKRSRLVSGSGSDNKYAGMSSLNSTTEVVEVHTAWSFTAESAIDKISIFGGALRDWQHSRRQNTTKRIGELQRFLDSCMHRRITDYEQSVFLSAKTELKSLLDKDEQYWAQCSRVNWLQFGDRNSAYFHARASGRKKKNRIRGPFDEMNIWTDKQDEVANVAVRYFETLFTSSQPQSPSALLDLIVPTVILI
ncbi:hypothetical protein V6N13_040437 [Hibiscus sabdariffa]